MDKFFLGLLVFLPATYAAVLWGAPPVWLFFLSALAIIPLAKYIGEATEEIASRTGPALGGFLNATFGNATELIIGILAIKAGLLEVVKASITGSIIGNLLLVSGTAMFFGGRKRKEQKFNKTAASASSSTLLLAVVALTIPAIFLQTAPGVAATTIERLSVFVAVCMILIYFANLFFSLFTHKHLYTEEVGTYESYWSMRRSVIVLFLATLAVAYASDVLVSSIEPVVSQFGWTELFVGVVFVAIIGNIAEHTSAITVAVKNRMDLALQISIGSASQIAMFVAPVLVLSSLFLKTQMSLVFNTLELVALILSVLMLNLVVQDGESNWLEGIQLVFAYAIIAAAFFIQPE